MSTYFGVASWTAAARARESARPDRLFYDPFAAELAGVEGFAQMARLEQLIALPGSATTESPYLAVRTRIVDDFLADAIHETGARQVVILGAGLDTRAFRLAWPADCVVYELDRMGVLAFKKARLEKLGAAPRCVRRAVHADLGGRWTRAIVAAGFDTLRPSVWILEGQLACLRDDQARTVLRQAAANAAPSSRMFADVVGQSLLESPVTVAYLAELERDGTPWLFGTDDPEGLFDACGWETRVTMPGEEGALFGRWPYPVLPRNTPGVPQAFFVRARRPA